MDSKKVIVLILAATLIAGVQSDPSTDLTFPVVHMKSASGHYKYTWDQARDVCMSQGMNMATSVQLQDAFELGMDMCACGWLADGSVKYPIQNPRSGCGTEAAGLRTCPDDPSSWNLVGYDVYCSTIPAPVTHIMSSAGHYQLSWETAKRECQSRGLPMALMSSLIAAQKMGYDMCACGWLADGNVHYPITKPRTGCGSSPGGIRTCPKDPADWTVNGWDVYCGVEQVPVVRLQADEGHYKFTQDDAELACARVGMAVASPGELLTAQTMGYDECACGWLSDGTVHYAINNPRSGCGLVPPGIRTCPTNSTEWSVPGWDVYCSTVRKVPEPPPPTADPSNAQKQWQVRLADGANPCVGRVETYDGNQWGTICALGININGWVWVVCKDLGCGKAVDKGFCNTKDCMVPDGYHMALRGPSCSGKKFSEFHMCDMDGTIDCDHKKDVWIQCEYDAPQIAVEP